MRRENWARQALGWLAAGCLPWLSLLVAQQVGQVRGYVFGPDGQPLSGAIVRFERVETDIRSDLKTDKKGFYQITTILPGNYTVTVTVDGRLRARRTMYRINMGGQDPSDIANGDTASGLVFRLNPPDGPVVESRSEVEGNMESDVVTKRKRGAGQASPPPPPAGLTAPASASAKTPEEKRAALAQKQALDAAYASGKSAMDSKNYDAAIESFNHAKTIDETQAAVWIALADAYLRRSSQPGAADKSGDRARADEAFRKAIALSPNTPSYYQSYALAQAQSDKLDDAKANVAKAIALDPGGAAIYHYNLGSILMSVNQNDAAISEFKSSIESDPTHASSYYQYGVALAGKATVDANGKITPPPGCIEALKKYLELQPNGPDSAAAKDMIAAMGAR